VQFRVPAHPLENEALQPALTRFAFVAERRHTEGSAAASVAAEGVARAALVRVATAVVALVRAATCALYVRALCDPQRTHVTDEGVLDSCGVNTISTMRESL